jgi:PDZ domain-containing protein
MTTEITESVVQLEAAEVSAKRAKALLFAFFLLGLSVIIAAGFIIKTDKAALMPGSARETESLVSVSGLESFPSDGEVFYTTVRVRVKPSYWEYLWFSRDDEIRIVDAEAVLGSRTTDENRERNLVLMSDSKSVAVAVALEQLGYPALESTGIWIAEVSSGEAADGVFNAGDVIVALDGEELLTSVGLIDALREYKPGDPATFKVHLADGGEPVELSVILGQHPDDPDRAFLGIAPTDVLVVDPDIGVDVSIDSGDVGGPSAGLAFTLAVLDNLTEGELTGGSNIAVTGTISADGRVGPVGGVPQKAAAVRDLGLETFIVPLSLGEDVIAEARAVVGDEVEIVPVANLAEALAALERLGGNVDAINEFAAANTN